MPRPPILPVLDWKAVFESGLEYPQWIQQGDSPENRQKMEASRASLALTPQTEGFLRGLARPVHVVAIAEDWCGDVVRHVPVLQRLADTASNLKVRYLRRDQHPNVFVRFLTNGGEAVPKFVFLSEAFVECGSWGPMPEPHRELIARGKAAGDVAAARAKVHSLYEADPGFRQAIAELLRLIDIAATTKP